MSFFPEIYNLIITVVIAISVLSAVVTYLWLMRSRLNRISGQLALFMESGEDGDAENALDRISGMLQALQASRQSDIEQMQQRIASLNSGVQDLAILLDSIKTETTQSAERDLESVKAAIGKETGLMREFIESRLENLRIRLRPDDVSTNPQANSQSPSRASATDSRGWAHGYRSTGQVADAPAEPLNPSDLSRP